MLQNAPALLEVSATEQIQVVQDVIELIDGDASFDIVMIVDRARVRLEARGRKAAEEPHHRDVRPAVTDRASGVDDGDPSARPEITVTAV